MNQPIREINEQLRRDAAGLIRQADAAYDAHLEAIADDIRAHRAERPIILLSGPSGSGKTTTARMIEKKLDDSDVETHTLSMDDYFLPLTPEEQALAAEEKFDLEAPSRVDIPLLNQQLSSILAGEPTALPHFVFSTNTRQSSGRVLTRRPGELVILEGIHALNPAVITLPDDCTARLYVSVRTRVTTDSGTPLHPSRIRLLRRMLRDKRFRSRPVGETLHMLASVQRGEERYIMPYKHRAGYEVDTFFPYELSVYRQELLADLLPLSALPEVPQLVSFLEQLDPLSPEAVPAHALIREFIGDSAYH